MPKWVDVTHNTKYAMPKKKLWPYRLPPAFSVSFDLSTKAEYSPIAQW